MCKHPEAHWADKEVVDFNNITYVTRTEKRDWDRALRKHHSMAG